VTKSYPRFVSDGEPIVRICVGDGGHPTGELGWQMGIDPGKFRRLTQPDATLRKSPDCGVFEIPPHSVHPVALDDPNCRADIFHLDNTRSNEKAEMSYRIHVQSWKDSSNLVASVSS
jgi:hypothetical protein